MNSIIRKQLKEYYAFWLGLDQVYGEWAKVHGLSLHGLFTLYGIWVSGGGCTQKEICDKWMMPKQTVNSILKVMEKKGYISYQRQEEDRREKKLLLTDSGQAYADGILTPLFRLEERVMERMEEEDREAMTRCNAFFLRMMREEMRGENHD